MHNLRSQADDPSLKTKAQRLRRLTLTEAKRLVKSIGLILTFEEETNEYIVRNPRDRSKDDSKNSTYFADDLCDAVETAYAMVGKTWRAA